MKRLLVIASLVCFLLPFTAQAKSSSFSNAVSEWLDDSAGQDLQFSFEKRKIQFQGCKQKAYDLVITQRFAETFSLDMSLGYAKGRNSFGVFSQTVLVKEYQIIPRWHFEQFALGIGMKVQSSHELRSSHGPEFKLPLQETFAVEADLPAFSESHHLRLTLSHEQWKSDDIAFSNAGYSAENNQLTVEYSIAF